jgi:hypothetical protein
MKKAGIPFPPATIVAHHGNREEKLTDHNCLHVLISFLPHE